MCLVLLLGVAMTADGKPEIIASNSTGGVTLWNMRNPASSATAPVYGTSFPAIANLNVTGVMYPIDFDASGTVDLVTYKYVCAAASVLLPCCGGGAVALAPFLLSCSGDAWLIARLMGVDGFCAVILPHPTVLPQSWHVIRQILQ